MYSILGIRYTGDIKPLPYQLKQTDFDDTEHGKGRALMIVAIIEFLVLIWIFSFIIAKTNFITMFAASTFYFDSNENKVGESKVF